MSSSEEVPPASDPRWTVWARPLLTYMQKTGPISWAELGEWAKAVRCPESRVRQLLAHLEIAGMASATRPSHGVWVWHAVGAMKQKVRKPPTAKLRKKFEEHFTGDDGLL